MNVSVIIPHFQKQKAFLDTAPRLLSQLEEGDEVIVVDDWSPDGFNLVTPKLRIVRPKKNINHIYRLSTLRNLGLEEAVNDTCIILDPDCKIDWDFIEKVKKSFNPACVYGGRIDFQREDGGVDPDPRTIRGYPLGWMIWGGCMVFSKSRTKLAQVNGQWFSEEFNNRWGVEDNDFANRCYHSGMVLVYAKELSCLHLYHERSFVGAHINQGIAANNLRDYTTSLNQVSDYKPRVGVLVVTMMRPAFLEQCLYSLARVKIPIKIYLVNQGDKSDETMAVINKWRQKWSVTYKENDSIEGLAAMKRWGMQLMKTEGMEYTVIIDDDVCLIGNCLENLVQIADMNPHLHSISGWLDEGVSKRMLGGNSITVPEGVSYPRMKIIPGLQEVEWVGGGFTLHRLDPMVLHDPAYLIGLEDFDYSKELKRRGLRCAVFGGAGALHKLLIKDGQAQRQGAKGKYLAIRMDRKRIRHSQEHFEEKWGFEVV